MVRAGRRDKPVASSEPRTRSGWTKRRRLGNTAKPTTAGKQQEGEKNSGNTGSFEASSDPSSSDMADVGFTFPGPELHFKPRLLPRGQLGGRRAPRRMVIRSDRSPNQRDEESRLAKQYYDKTVEKLQLALDSIMGQGETTVGQAKTAALQCSQEELYRGVESLCRDSQSQRVYEILRTSMECHAATFPQELEPSARKVIEMSSIVDIDAALGSQEAFLKRLVDMWKEWSVKVIFVRNIFYYLDRSYLLPSSHHKEIWNIAVDLFDQFAFTDTTYDGIERCVISILSAVERDHVSVIGYARRDGKTVAEGSYSSTPSELLVNHSAVSSLFSVLAEFPRVRTRIRDAVLRSYTHFATELAQSLAQSGIVTYIQNFTRQLDFDKRLYTSVGFKQGEVEDTAKQLGAAFLPSEPYSGRNGQAVDSNAILSQVGVLVNEQLLSDFHALFELCDSRQMNDKLLAMFKQHVLEEGRRIILQRESKTVRTIPLLIDLYQRSHNIAKETAKIKGREYEICMTDSMFAILNQIGSGHVASERLAKYMDEVLKPNKMGLSSMELDELLNNCILLFRCVDGKHEFEAFYKALFAKRLLQNKTISIETEKAVVSMLKGECGPGFTEKLETMISDMEMSKQHMSDFLASEHASGSGPQFAVNVLRTDHWPSYAGITINLPESLVRRQEEFERFYKSKEKGRKLVWHSLLGSCLMKAHFTHGTKELSLNMLQGVVLELFNERESMTLEDIMIITGMSQSNAVRTVQSLSTSRYKILVKEPESGDIQGSDIFRFNAGFTDKSYRLKISTVQMKESVRRDSDIRREAAINRDDEVRAAIVRVMKARKQLKHVDLIQQVIDVTKRRGSVDVRTIKKMMEELINKEFIAREGSDQYTYVAE